MLETTMRIFGVEGASLLLIDWGKSMLAFRHARGPGTKEILDIELPLDPDSSVAAWSVAHREVVNVPEAGVDPRHCADVDRQTGYKTRSLLAAPVVWGDRALGVIELVNKTSGPFSNADVEHVKIVAAQLALALHNTMAVRQLHNFYQQCIETLIDCFQAFDPVSHDHVVHVAGLATSIGRLLRLPDEDMEALSYAALLHDIGKIRVADSNDTRHADIGGTMLQQVTLFNRMVPAVRYHHERYDGSGPSHLAETTFPCWRAFSLLRKRGAKKAT